MGDMALCCASAGPWQEITHDESMLPERRAKREAKEVEED